MGFREDLKRGKLISNQDNLGFEIEEFKNQARRYRAEIMNLKKQIDSLKTDIIMLQKEKCEDSA